MRTRNDRRRKSTKFLRDNPELDDDRYSNEAVAQHVRVRQREMQYRNSHPVLKLYGIVDQVTIDDSKEELRKSF